LADPGVLVYALLLRAWVVRVQYVVGGTGMARPMTPIITFTTGCGGATIERLETRPAGCMAAMAEIRGTDDAGSSPRRWWSSVSS
jgi:hypothetical protein